MIVERRVRLTYPKHLLDHPLLSRLIRQFDLLTNILEARVTDKEGWLIIVVRGERQKVEQGLAWMVEQGVQVKTLSEIEEER